MDTRDRFRVDSGHCSAYAGTENTTLFITREGEWSMANLQSKSAAPKAKGAAAKAAKTSGAASAATSVKPQPQRFRLSVPAADEAVLMWMELQDNPSSSVRMLIRESIERLGYVDVVNRPVVQLPPSGRPVAPEPAAREEVSIQEVRAAVAAAAPLVFIQKPAPKQDVVDASSSNAPEPEQPPVGQLEVNDLFSKLR